MQKEAAKLATDTQERLKKPKSKRKNKKHMLNISPEVRALNPFTGFEMSYEDTEEDYDRLQESCKRYDLGDATPDDFGQSLSYSQHSYDEDSDYEEF